MSSSLYNRLKKIKDNKVDQDRRGNKRSKVSHRDFFTSVGVRQEPLQPTNSLWKLVRPGVWELKTLFPLAIDPNLIYHGLEGHPGNWAWFDTETTGLSNGAGTVIFLFGIASPRMGSWECTQVFLEDYPYEPEFLGRIQELICQFDGLASYNGSTFDLPLLRSRFIMNGLVVPEIHHLDLLRPVRRLWRDSRVSCSLGTIEHEILGVQRIRDVAGMLIPGLYQEYLRAAIPDPGSFTSLSDVFAHHLSDHWSMIQLTQVLGTVTLALKQKSDSSAFEEWGITRLGLLRFLVPQGYSKNDLDYLAGLTLEQGSGFAQLLPRLLIGLGDYSSSLPWLKAGVGDGSLWSLERLLIYYEHREKNPSKALKELEDYWAIHPDSRMRLSQAQGARWNSRHQRLRRKSG